MPPRSLLIIDDDYRIREVTKATLEIIATWNVLTASSGQEGVLMAKTKQPDGILLDMMMPGLDGFSILDNLNAEPLTQDIPIVILTAKARINQDDRLKGKKYAGVIQKPFDSLQLHSIISKLLGWEI